MHTKHRVFNFLFHDTVSSVCACVCVCALSGCRSRGCCLSIVIVLDSAHLFAFESVRTCVFGVCACVCDIIISDCEVTF